MITNKDKYVIFLTIPGLRTQDVSAMPNLSSIAKNGRQCRIQHSFPAVTWPSQANVLTGKNVDQHGVVANGFYWRKESKVEMWTAWNEVIQQPQIWDVLRSKGRTSGAWFPMLSKGCGADFVCMPAPIHKPDGSEDLWCYTKPQEFYGELLEQIGHFPLQHFWGPLANIKSSQWIADSAVRAAQKFKPDFFYIYLPHLDYAAQKDGPDSDAAVSAVQELDQLIGSLAESMSSIYGENIVWIAASEYVITAVDHVTYPNRLLRDAGLLQVEMNDAREHLDFKNSEAWALVDHQFSHIFVKDRELSVVEKIAQLFENRDGIAEVLSGNSLEKYQLNHERSGDVVLISTANSWQAYYWWEDNNMAPKFASTVDIHQKPGYDPVELHFDFATKTVPMDATLIKGSHGAPVTSEEQKGVFLSNLDLNLENTISDTKIFDLVLNLFDSNA